MTTTRIFLVAYADTEGPYAVAFSTRENADAFVASFSAWRRDDFTIIDTTVDQARVVAKKHRPKKSAAPIFDCSSCGEQWLVEDLEEKTWQQWRCMACGSWNSFPMENAR